MQRLSLTDMVHGYEALAEQAAQKNLPYCDFLEQVLESEAMSGRRGTSKCARNWRAFQTPSG